MKNLNKFNNNDKGVSPVIGVILMVAATIVIAGVIMAMLGGFAPVEPPRSVAATAHHINATHIAVVFHGGPDGGLVTALNVTIDGTHIGPTPSMGVVVATPLRVGESIASSTNVQGGPDNDHVIVTARFTDGTHQVVLDVRV